MRLSRYLLYPWQARSHKADINHVVDHGYAHLLQVLDPDKTVVTAHDLIPLLAWNGRIPGMTYPHRPRLGEYSLRFLRKARYVFAVSESTKKDLIEHCGCSPDRIRVIYYGLHTSFRVFGPRERTRVRRDLGLPDETVKLILITGRQSYKNHPVCLQVLRRIQAESQDRVAMVRVGRSTAEWEAALGATGTRQSVISIPFLPHNRMVDLYNSVDCLLFPSLYEGFGWPPLEAMACGAPVVTSNVASLPEVVGEAGLMREPGDVEGLAASVRAVLEDADLRKNLTERGLVRARSFTWERHATQVLQAYEELV
jgi:glycosyltransferase involved in cell wall biosynthesis